METGLITQIIIGVSLSTEAKSTEIMCGKYAQCYCMSHHLLLTYTDNFPL